LGGLPPNSRRKLFIGSATWRLAAPVMKRYHGSLPSFSPGFESRRAH
jgi:hypothetical protein